MSEAPNTVDWAQPEVSPHNATSANHVSTREDEMVAAFSAAMGLYDRELSPAYLFARGLA
jgi:hypothetical protein